MPGTPRPNDPSFLDPEIAERLLDGALALDEVPSPLRPLAGLLAAASAPAHPGELAGEAAAAAAFVAAYEGSPGETTTFRRRPMILQVLTTKVAACALAGTALVGGGAAAAATGKLPDGPQSMVHETLSHVGVQVPDAAGHVKAVGSVADDEGPGVEGKGGAVCTLASGATCQAGVNGKVHDDKPGDREDDDKTDAKTHEGHEGDEDDAPAPSSTLPGVSVRVEGQGGVAPLGQGGDVHAKVETPAGHVDAGVSGQGGERHVEGNLSVTPPSIPLPTRHP